MAQVSTNTAFSVVLIVRSTLFNVPGGDTIQINETANMLNKAGIRADIKRTNEVIDYSDYNLLHFFNITRPADILYHIRKSRMPYVVSTIYIDYSGYDKKYRKGVSGFLFKYLSADGCEYLKTIMRRVKGNDTMMSVDYLWKGQRLSIKNIIEKAAMLLPGSSSEYRRLNCQYAINCHYKVINNGVDPGLFFMNGNVLRDDDLVLCVARIEGIKNQLNLIRALNNTKYKLLLIGSPAPNQMGYYETCKSIAAPNVQFLNNIPQQDLLPYYQRAGIHILPSFFETTGLSSLEAAAMGCKIIVSPRGDTAEYFRNLAGYCNPESCESIYAAVNEMHAQPYSDTLSKKILKDYTWGQATSAIIHAYKDVIESYETTHCHPRYKRNP